MAPLVFLGCRKVLLLSVLFFLFASVCFSAFSEPQLESKQLSSRRRVLLELEEQEEFEQPLKKKSTKNQTKLIKPKSNNNLSLKNQSKTIKSNNLSTKNQTKLAKTTSLTDTTLTKKLNSTTFKTKKLNSTLSKAITNSTSTKKSLDLTKASGAKNKTTKATAGITKNKETNSIKINNKKVSSDQSETEKQNKQQSKKTNVVKKQSPPSWVFEEEDSDLVSEFKDLPIKFQQTLIPDLERISTTSKAYITKANKEITKGFKPYVGNKYASTIATLLSCAFVLIPFVLVSFLFNKIKAYFSLQKLLIFIQAYLSIYFSILCLSSLITGLEPLRFFYSTSQSTYLFLQVIQTLAYVLYLLLLIMYLILVFSTDCGLSSKFLGLAQTFVGYAVGLHYYMTVFHRVVLRQPPKTNWKVHGIYATCFLLVCLLATADRRKKTYLEEGGEEGKKN